MYGEQDSRSIGIQWLDKAYSHQDNSTIEHINVSQELLCLSCDWLWVTFHGFPGKGVELNRARTSRDRQLLATRGLWLRGTFVYPIIHQIFSI